MDFVYYGKAPALGCYGCKLPNGRGAVNNRGKTHNRFKVWTFLQSMELFEKVESQSQKQEGGK